MGWWAGGLVVCLPSSPCHMAHRSPLNGRAHHSWPQATSCPVSAALEGGYNAPVTSACCEATLRALLGEHTPPPPPTFLSRSTEATLRAVVTTQKRYWPVLEQQVRGYISYVCARSGQVASTGTGTRYRSWRGYLWRLHRHVETG